MAKLVMTEDETMLADSARGFLDSEAPVKALRDLRDAGKTHDAALWKKMADMGWAGVLVPESAGGSDMGSAAATVFACPGKSSSWLMADWPTGCWFWRGRTTG